MIAGILIEAPFHGARRQLQSTLPQALAFVELARSAAARSEATERAVRLPSASQTSWK